METTHRTRLGQEAADRAVQWQLTQDAAKRWPLGPKKSRVGLAPILSRVETDLVELLARSAGTVTPEIRRLQTEQERLLRRMRAIRRAAQEADPAGVAAEILSVASTVTDAPTTITVPWTNAQFQESFELLVHNIALISQYFWDVNNGSPDRRAQMVERARRTGAAAPFYDWFMRYPDLANLLFAGSNEGIAEKKEDIIRGDEEIIKGIIWRFLQENILDDIEKHNDTYTLRPAMDSAYFLADTLAEIFQCLVLPEDDMDLAKSIRQTVIRPAISLQQAMCVTNDDKYFLEFYHFAEAPKLYTRDIEELIRIRDRFNTMDVANDFDSNSLVGQTHIQIRRCMEPLCCVTPALMYVSTGEIQEGDKRMQPAINGQIHIIWGTPDARAAYKAQQMVGGTNFYYDLTRAHDEFTASLN